jgi:hypothetical protein
LPGSYKSTPACASRACSIWLAIGQRSPLGPVLAAADSRQPPQLPSSHSNCAKALCSPTAPRLGPLLRLCAAIAATLWPSLAESWRQCHLAVWDENPGLLGSPAWYCGAPAMDNPINATTTRTTIPTRTLNSVLPIFFRLLYYELASRRPHTCGRLPPLADFGNGSTPPGLQTQVKRVLVFAEVVHCPAFREAGWDMPRQSAGAFESSARSFAQGPPAPWRPRFT